MFEQRATAMLPEGMAPSRRDIAASAPMSVATAAADVKNRDRAACRLQLSAAAALLCLFALLPLLVGGAFDLARYNAALVLLMAAIGFNIAYGFAGEFVLGHAAIMAVSAYGAGIGGISLKLGPGASLLFGMGAGVAFGMCMMAAGVRISGWYFAFITLFAVLIMPAATQIFPGITGGSDGLSGLPPFGLFGFTLPGWLFFEFVLLCFAVVWLGSAWIARSRFGLRLRALRDAPRAARTVGIGLGRLRMLAYLASALPAALAGVLQAFTERFVHVDSFGPNLALLLLTGVVLGGTGTVWGPLLGMAPLIAVSFWIGAFSQYNAIALGAALLVGVLLFPEGLVAVIARRFDRRRSAVVQRDGVAATLGTQEESAFWTRVPRAALQSTQPIIEVSGIFKSFGGVAALRGAGFELRQGVLCGLVGPNGCGKSTLLNVLSGFIAPDEGRIVVLGRDVAGWNTARVARIGAGRTFQIPQIVSDLTVLQNIELGLESAALDAGARQARVLDTFSKLQLPVALMGVPLAEIPLGLKRLVEVGRAIVSQPKLLLLDEPAAGLNNEERRKLGELLVTLRETGMTILVVEHDVRFVLNTCDELLFMELGEITTRSALDGTQLPAALQKYLSYGVAWEAAAPGALHA